MHGWYCKSQLSFKNTGCPKTCIDTNSCPYQNIIHITFLFCHPLSPNTWSLCYEVYAFGRPMMYLYDFMCSTPFHTFLYSAFLGVHCILNFQSATTNYDLHHHHILSLYIGAGEVLENIFTVNKVLELLWLGEVAKTKLFLAACVTHLLPSTGNKLTCNNH